MSTSEEKDVLANQIGDMGGEPDGLGNEGLGNGGLGKLNHIPGTKDELTQEERIDLDKFNAATFKIHSRAKNNDISDGWIPIDRSQMSFRSMFYPEDWEFRIRCATVEAIKNWSSIEDENLSVINNVINEILKTCVSIYSPSRGAISWEKINSWDKFWFVLKVREYTFSKGEAALEFDEDCDNCGSSVHYTLQSDYLYYEYPDNDVVERHWNQAKMTWEIDPREYDVEHPQIRLYCPTVGKDQAIISWLVSQNEAGKNIDENFIKFLPYMLEFAPKDSNLLDRKIKECKSEFKSWDVETFLFMDEVRKNITINPSEKLTQVCPSCGAEVRSTVRFPNGIKYLFAVQGRHKKFGSK